MILKLNPASTQAGREEIRSALTEAGLPVRFTDLNGIRAFVGPSDPDPALRAWLMEHPATQELLPFSKEYPLASRQYKAEKTVIDVRGVPIGGPAVNIMAGPCSVETEEQIFAVAEYLHSLGVKFIRGGAYKPRTSPYRFQGLGLEGLKLIKKAADAYNLRVVTEIIDSSLIDEIYPYADILQVGSRNMQNFYFLKQLGKIDKPVLLKRGMYARIEEWLNAAEYILSEGNEKVILCERGIRTFDNIVRNTLDITAIPLIQSLSHLPVMADPSHGTGRRDLVQPMAMASLAAGADGLIVEIHPDPEKALSDGMQSLYLDQFSQLVTKAGQIAAITGRKLDTEIAPQNQITLNICVE